MPTKQLYIKGEDLAVYERAEKIAAEEARCAKANSQADRIYDKLAETYGERPEVVNARTRQAREESLMMAYNREHGTRWNLADRGKWLAALKIS